MTFADDEDDEGGSPLPAAIMPFQERGKETKDLGAKVSDLVFAELVANPDLYLVDREDLGKVLGELELSASGAVNPDEANRVGQLTGAKVLITGSVVQTETSMVLVAKVIGTETGRVFGASAKGKIDEPLEELTAKLAEQIGGVYTKNSKALVGKVVSREERIAKVVRALQDLEGKPRLAVEITERHIGSPSIDPAAQTELSLIAQEAGFTLAERKKDSKAEVDVVISGEAFSEFVGRVGNLASVRARVEIKAVDPKTGKVIAVDRQTAVIVDLGEQSAAKKALQEAAATMSLRFLPKLVEKKAKK